VIGKRYQGLAGNLFRRASEGPWPLG